MPDTAHAINIDGRLNIEGHTWLKHVSRQRMDMRSRCVIDGCESDTMTSRMSEGFTITAGFERLPRGVIYSGR
jgi:hypothetical protein